MGGCAIRGQGGGMKTPLVREKLTLRLPPELHRRLKSVAVDNGRSLNGEIVQRLRRSFDGGDPEGSELQ
jgi:predicted HicB family RNase H-like nuclease